MSSVITRKQAVARDISLGQQRHRVTRGAWQRVHPGVFVQHSGHITYRERLEAAVLARGDGARVSLECALHLWDLTDREPPIITLAEPVGIHRTKTLPGVRVRRRRRLAKGMRHGIPVTTVAQTLVDVGAEPGCPTDELISLITRAVAAKKVTAGQVRDELAHHPRHRRREFLDEVLRAADEGLESVAEVRYVERVENAHGLPRMERQFPIDGPAAVRDGRSRRQDFRDEARGVGVEVDGELFHRNRQAGDRARDRQAAGRGEVILRVSYFEIIDAPCALAADVAAALLARRWTGHPKRCSPACTIWRDPRLRAAQPVQSGTAAGA